MITTHHNGKLEAHKEVLIVLEKLVLIINSKMKEDLHPMERENLAGQRKALKGVCLLLKNKIKKIESHK